MSFTRYCAGSVTDAERSWVTIKKAKEARGTCFFVFADKNKIGREYRDKLKKQLESGDSHLPVTFTSLPVPLGPDLRCSAATASVATQQANVTHNVVYDVPKPVASSSRRRFEENYDDVMRGCETGDNATH